MSRIGDVVARRKWLLILPLIVVFLLPSIWSAATMRTYEANSLVWLDTNTSIASVLKVQGAEMNSNDAPIQAEADALEQLLQSRSFVSGILKKTPLRSRMDSPRELAKAVTYIQENTSVEGVGPNALKISFTGDSPGQAVSVVKAMTTALVDWTKNAAVRQSEDTVRLFAEQVAADSTNLEKARAELQAYKRKHPETKRFVVRDGMLETPDSDVSEEVQTEYLRLSLARENAEALYDSSVSELGATRVLSTLQRERYVSGLHTLDEPVAPTTFLLGPLLLFDFLALCAALLIAGLSIALAEASDKTVRGRHDVEALGLTPMAAIDAAYDRGGRT